MTQFRRLLVNVRPPRDVYEAVDCAFWLAKHSNAEITLAAVEKPVPVYLRTPAYGYPALSETLEAELKQALEGVAGRIRHEGLTVEITVKTGKPHIEITREAIARGADLVITQGEPHGEAVRLLRVCPSSVWAVKGGHVGPHRRIVAAVDPLAGDDHELELARKVVEHALGVARLQGGEVHVLYVWGEGLRPELLEEYGEPIEALARGSTSRSLRRNSRTGFQSLM